jgi:hypothetical protein
VLTEDKSYRPSQGGIAVESAGFVFCDALFEAAAGRANILRAVRAAEDVEIGAHPAPLATARWISASKLAAIA